MAVHFQAKFVNVSLASLASAWANQASFFRSLSAIYDLTSLLVYFRKYRFEANSTRSGRLLLERDGMSRT